jgi:hypothetical protein
MLPETGSMQSKFARIARQAQSAADMAVETALSIR